MSTAIIYPQNNGTIALVKPTGAIPLEDVAQKDVPAGVPYLFVDTATDIPGDFDFFDAWEADFTTPDGYGIGAEAWFAAHPPAERGPGRPAPEQP